MSRPPGGHPNVAFVATSQPCYPIRGRLVGLGHPMPRQAPRVPSVQGVSGGRSPPETKTGACGGPGARSELSTIDLQLRPPCLEKRLHKPLFVQTPPLATVRPGRGMVRPNMPLRTEAICDRCGHRETFGEKQSFPESPPPDWYGLKLTRRQDETYAFAWGLLCTTCYTGLQECLSGFQPFADAELATTDSEVAAAEADAKSVDAPPRRAVSSHRRLIRTCVSLDPAETRPRVSRWSLPPSAAPRPPATAALRCRTPSAAAGSGHRSAPRPSPQCRSRRSPSARRPRTPPRACRCS